MNIPTEMLMSIVALVTLAASGGALYVSMSLKSELAQLVTRLDDRYVRRRDAEPMAASIAHEEERYRSNRSAEMAEVKLSVDGIWENLSLIKQGTAKIEALLASSRKE